MSTNRLIISPRHLQTLTRHAEAAYPEECCGVLLGRYRSPADGGSIVERVLSVNNERQDSRHNRYLIRPETVLAAHRQGRRLGLEIVGYYHSHPDHPAAPSDFDREHAWPGLSYVIVAVEGGRATAARSFRLSDDRARFTEERLDSGNGVEAAASILEEACG